MCRTCTATCSLVKYEWNIDFTLTLGCNLSTKTGVYVQMRLGNSVTCFFNPLCHAMCVELQLLLPAAPDQVAGCGLVFIQTLKALELGKNTELYRYLNRYEFRRSVKLYVLCDNDMNFFLSSTFSWVFLESTRM